MRRYILVLFLCAPCFAQNLLRIQKFCEVGGQKVITQGLNSTTQVQVSYPLCTVTVYDSGTLNKSAIFSDNLSTPTVLANPFTANVDGSWGFYAAPGACYDVVTSGAGMPAPFTYSYICLNTGGGIGGLPCPNTVINGAIGASNGVGGFNCDNNLLTDFHGDLTGNGANFIAPVNGFMGLTGGLPDPLQCPQTLPIPCFGATNTVYWLAPLTVVVPYANRPPATKGSVNQLPFLASQTTINGVPVNTWDWLTGTIVINGTSCALGGSCSITVGGTVEFQTNGVDNSNCTAGACPLLNNANGLGVIVTNTSGGIDQYALDGASQIATPAAPTLTVNGVTGATTYTYKVVACENPPVSTAACTRSTAASSTTSVANGNATLSSSNSITLSGYGDTLYGPRCFAIYRTVGGATQGMIANCAPKTFTDTGLTGDGSTAPSTNNTLLTLNMAPLPGCNIPAGGLIGPDAPPCSPTIFDDEMQASSCNPGDNNCVNWTWGNQQGASAAYTNGAITLTTDTQNTFEYLTSNQALPGTPYTFEIWVSANTVGVANTNGNGCYIGFRESGTSKIHTLEVINIQGATTGTGGGGWIWISRNSTSNTPGGALIYQAYSPNTAYLRMQLSGGNIVDYISPTGDGVNYLQWKSQAVTVPFTTTPNQLIIGGLGGGTGSTTCTFDFIRRTQ